MVAIVIMVQTLGKANCCQARLIKVRLKFTTYTTDNLFGCLFILFILHQRAHVSKSK